MQRRILTILFLIICVLGYSQNNEFNFPNFIGKKLNAIDNNSEWIVLKKSSGDLNNDGLKDSSLILESNDSILEKRCSDCKWLKSKPRMILVLFNENGSQKVIIQNNKFIARGMKVECYLILSQKFL